MTNKTTIDAPSQTVFCPAITYDYRVGNGKYGLALFANRNFKKGDEIFSESLEFHFTDVRDGDSLLLDQHEKASRKGNTEVPQFVPLKYEALEVTHGAVMLKPDPMNESAGSERWGLEVPGMFMNHSCNPNVTDYPRCAETGVGYAARDIQMGDELTSDYALDFYYDAHPSFRVCKCGEANCRGQLAGFRELNDTEKKKLLPETTRYVQAMHKADLGEGLPVKKMERPCISRTTTPRKDNEDGEVLRVMFPGPDTDEGVIVKQDENTQKFGIYAIRDFRIGEEVYNFWSTQWPLLDNNGVPVPVDMVFSEPTANNHPKEGTVVRINPLERAPQDEDGNYLFCGWDLLASHSCEPNIVYDFNDEEEQWRTVYAAKEIKAGDMLTTDLNTMRWDRSIYDYLGTGECHCGASKCTGTTKGFKFLSPKDQEERKTMSWLHKTPPLTRTYDEDGEGSDSDSDSDASSVNPVKALAPYVLGSFEE
eukprot:scaffold59827_cov51-Attheya_sp.AAC.5